jgi:hypothetical protein
VRGQLTHQAGFPDASLPDQADQPTLPGSDSVKLRDEPGQLGVSSNHVRTQHTDHEAQYRAEICQPCSE